MSPAEFKSLYSTIPHLPGVYKYYNDKKKLLYVGKAKDLNKRVNSYFTGKHQQAKTQRLVLEIHSIDYHIVSNENDALLLENNLIKTHKPPYNISLKDDKTYPYIIIRKEDFPRVYLTRRYQKDMGEFYGPFTAVGSAYDVMDYLRDYFKFRTCSLDLSPQKIQAKKYKPCLQYHIKKCKAPCVGFQSEEDYQHDLVEARQILSGKLHTVQQHFRKELDAAVAKLEFERAEDLKQKLIGLDKFKSKSIIVSKNLEDCDVLVFKNQDDVLYFTFFQIENSQLVRAHQQAIEKQLEENDEDIFWHVLLFLKTKFSSTTKKVLTNNTLAQAYNDIDINIPKIGDKKKLVDLAVKNTEVYIQKSIEDQKLKSIGVKSKTDILHNIQQALSIPELPVHIECFDNSNIQGTSPVAAMVCFRNGTPSKKDYRLFHIKTVEGPDDFASMEEIVYRRYSRLQEEKKEFPQLVIIDGGKGQLSSAMKSIKKLGLENKMVVVGLAKKKEELFFHNKSEPYHFPMYSAELNLIRYIRDEVHRFGITFHRKTESKNAQKSAIDSISGLGPKTKEKLLKKYKSLSKIKTADKNEIMTLIGEKKTSILFEMLEKNLRK